MDKVKSKKKLRINFSKIALKLSYRPDIVRLIHKLIKIIERKNKFISKLKNRINKKTHPTVAHASSQYDLQNNDKEAIGTQNDWTIKNKDGNEIKNIADQVKEAAEQALQYTGMVYVESAGMYYDYKTGYYYNPTSGLYYHGSTGCYYYYSEEKNEFIFHSQADTNSTAYNDNLTKHLKKRKPKQDNLEDNGSCKKKKKVKRDEITIKTGDAESKTKSPIKNLKKDTDNEITTAEPETNSEKDAKNNIDIFEDEIKDTESTHRKENNKEDLEEGECSDSEEEKGEANDEDVSSSETESESPEELADQAPSIRLVVKETEIPSLQVGSLFLITKLGGSLGREGGQHSIILKDENVSRVHLEFKYEEATNDYSVIDLGSRNGTILDGKLLPKSNDSNESTKVLHGSTLQIGVTKLLCHIHRGHETCGHCEPGLIIEKPKSPPRPFRTVDVKKQHRLELARLKNKYKPRPPPAICDKDYVDRAKERRTEKGSSHSSHKTLQSDVHTEIDSNNKGFKMLKNMGWSKGEGLGKSQTGTTEPVPLIANRGSAGLGAVGLVNIVSTPADIRLAKPKLLKPAKAFLDELNDDEA